MLNLIGWIGSLSLAFCGLPQAIQSYRTKSSDGINSGFLSLWLVGEVCTLIYVSMSLTSIQLLTNYSINLLCLSVIIYYKLIPGGRD